MEAQLSSTEVTHLIPHGHPGEGSVFGFGQVGLVSRTLSVAVRADRRLRARGHGHIADSVVARTA